MYRLIVITFAMLASIGCVHIEREIIKESTIFCSETTKDANQLRLTIDIKNTDLKLALHKQVYLPYFSKDRPLYLRIANEMLSWSNNLFLLAEVIPTERENLFMLQITGFKKPKSVNRLWRSYILLTLCQDAEMIIKGDKMEFSLKAKLELVEKQ